MKLSATYMEDTAITKASGRSRFFPTPHPRVRHLVAGHMRERPGYHVRRPQGSGDWLMVLTVDGSGRFGHARGQLVTHAGDLVLVARGAAHDYGLAAGAESWELLWAHFQARPHWLAWLDWPEAGPGVGHLVLDSSRAAGRVREGLERMYAVATGAMPDRLLLAMNALEWALIWSRRINPRAGEPMLDERIEQAMRYLGENMTEPITIGEVAAAVHLSPSRLAHLFREQTALTPMQFLERHRLERAKELLSTTPHPIGAVAQAVGFADAFYFSRRFKAHTGFTPRGYRRGEGTG